MKKVVLAIGDTHFSDADYGQHKDYASDCLTMMKRVADAVEQYAEKLGGKFYRIVLLGDFADRRFTKLEFRVEVEKFLSRLGAVAEAVYCLNGNHDVVGGSMTEREYYIARGMIAEHPTDEVVGGKNVRYVDFIRDPEECAQAHEGPDVEIVFTHNALAAGENTLFLSVDVSKLDAPKLRVGVMGHIHGEMYFKAHNRHGQDVSILDGGAACVKSTKRKDVECFNMLALHIDEETGKIGSKKIPVKYVEDAFTDKPVDDDGKWSVAKDTETKIDFSVTGVGAMDVDDLIKRIEEEESAEVGVAVRELFAKYGNVDAGDQEMDAGATDDTLMDDILGMFRKAEDKAAETDVNVPVASIKSDAVEQADDALDDLADEDDVTADAESAEDDLDALADDDDDSLDALSEEGADDLAELAGLDTKEDVSDELLDLVDDDEEAVSIVELLSEQERECLMEGSLDYVEVDGLRIVYKDGDFTVE